MMECLNCGKEVTGNGKYCNGSCRATYSRRNRRSATPETEAQHTSATLPEQKAFISKFNCAVPLPGDDGYVGVCYKDEHGNWSIRQRTKQPTIEQVAFNAMSYSNMAKIVYDDYSLGKGITPQGARASMSDTPVSDTTQKLEVLI